MALTRTALLAGAAALAFAGLAGVAHAESARAHVLTLQLPGGGTEQIRYTGDVPPQIVLQPDTGALQIAMMPMAGGAWASPFAAFDRIAAEMDQQAAAMLQQAQAMSRAALTNVDNLMMMPPGMSPGALPAGTQGYTFVSTFSGNGVCTRSVTITSDGNGAKPKVVSQVSGNCGVPSRGAESAVQREMPIPARLPHTIQVKAEGRASNAPIYAGIVHPIPNWPQ